MAITIGVLASCSSGSTVVSNPASSSVGSTLLRSTPGRGGPGSIADIAVFLAPGTGDADLQAVGERLQHTEDGKTGVFMNPGVFAISYDYQRPTVYVNLQPDITEDQRQAIIAQVRSAPNVDDVKFGYVEGSAK